MILKKKYLVYKPKTGSLKMNKAEHSLFSSLENLPYVYKKQLIETHINNSTDRSIAIERLEEIFMAWTKPDIGTGLKIDVSDELRIIFELKNKIARSAKTKKGLPQRENKTKRISLRDNLRKPDQVVTAIKEFLSKNDNMIKRQKAAVTLLEVCKDKDVKADGAKVARFFHENRIVTGIELSSLEKYFRKGPLKKIESDTSLKASLINHI